MLSHQFAIKFCTMFVCGVCVYILEQLQNGFSVSLCCSHFCQRRTLINVFLPFLIVKLFSRAHNLLPRPKLSHHTHTHNSSSSVSGSNRTHIPDTINQEPCTIAKIYLAHVDYTRYYNTQYITFYSATCYQYQIP